MRRFFAFWYDFIVGDDWFIAVATIAAILLTWAGARAGLAGWPVMLIAIPGVLAGSILRHR